MVPGQRKPARLPFLLIASLVFGSAEVLAQPDACRLKLESDTESSVPYKPRNGRCEGLYVESKSANNPIDVIGYHVHPPVFDVSRDTPLRVTPDTGGRATEALVAVTKNPRHYYQMDKSSIPPGASFRWPTEIISRPAIGLSPSKLAILACVEACTELTLEPPLIAPVSVTQFSDPADSTPRLILRPGTSLEELYVTLKGPDDSLVLDEQPMQRGFYPAGQSFSLTLSPDQGVPIDESGTYELRLLGLSQDGMTVSTTRRIHIPEGRK